MAIRAHQHRSYAATVRIIERVSRVMNNVGGVILFILMMLTVCDVFMRYVFNLPIMGTTELTRYMLVVLVFLGMAWCAVRLKHVKVDLVMSRFSARVQAIVDIITYFFSLVICIIMAWRVLLESVTVQRLGISSSLLKVPDFPFYVLLALGLFILSLVVMIQIVQIMVNRVSGHEP
jgi:TRAP-type C4-dicarboxylate transport system permease small subunit